MTLHEQLANAVAACLPGYGVAGLKEAPSAKTLWPVLTGTFGLWPPQTIIACPVHTAVGSRRPSSGAQGSADQRLTFGSKARPRRATAKAPASLDVLPPQISSRFPVHTVAACERCDGIEASRRQRFVAGA